MLVYPMFAMVVLTFSVLVRLFRARTRFVLAWFYVLARCAHAYIHTGRNPLNQRIAAYFSSWIVLIVMWLCIVLGVVAQNG